MLPLHFSQNHSAFFLGWFFLENKEQGQGSPLKYIQGTFDKLTEMKKSYVVMPMQLQWNHQPQGPSQPKLKKKVERSYGDCIVVTDHSVLLVLLRFQFPADVARIRMKTFVRNSLSSQLLLWLLRACLLFASLYSLSDLFFPGCYKG